MKVNFKELTKGCDHTDQCTCPIVKYESEDGICSHKACEGRMTECGKIIAVVEA